MIPIQNLHKQTNYGLIVSVFIHILIFALPVSMVVKKQIRNIELFVLTEDVRMQPERIVRQKAVTVSEPKAETPPEIQERPIPQEPLKHEEKKQEPTETAEKKIIDETVRTVQVADPSAESKASDSSVHASSVPVDTEFGAAIAPAFLHREIPVYTIIARKLGKEGRVVLRLTIDDRGTLLNIEVVEKAGYGFTEAAIEAVKKSTFLPAKKNGKPIASRALLPVRFQLRRD